MTTPPTTPVPATAPDPGPIAPGATSPTDPGSPPPDPPEAASPLPLAEPPVAGRQGNYAGAVTRLVAFAADVGASWGVFTVSLAAITFAIQLVTGKKIDLTQGHISAVIVLIALVVWEFIYFAYQWTLSGKTVGMALLGIRVVGTAGDAITGRQAVIRTVTLPLSFLFFGLGFLGILVNRDRHAWHDRMAKTVVVYSWDARAARLRWLAKQDPSTPA